MNKKRKYGPTPKPEAEKRKHLFACRLTDSELDQLDQGRPPGMTRGAWLRTKALKRKLPRQIPEVNRQSYIELARLAGNLNQYVKAINQGRATEPAPDLQVMYNEVQKLRSELLGIKDDESES